MKTRDDILNFLSQNKNYFRERFHIVKIGLFGSFARNDQNSASDIDLIVEFKDNTQNLYNLKREMKLFIKKELNLDVDIAREKYIKPKYKKSILKETHYVE
ncbi:MAG: nucleotidyltransferase domain-containing protein [Bacteroidales bacterium]|jgi:predicted nucleotidyltransferase|nr:nucleotidyltransferase domain-containing protein [Bacteroidales bacterium]